MRCRWRELLSCVGTLLTAAPAAAQQTREIGVQSIAAFADPAAVVAGVYGAWRTSGRTRLSASLGLGTAGGELAWRAEALGHFLLSPDERRRPGFYFAGGIAGVGGPVSRGYLVLIVGLEQRPQARSGWVLEAGVGGGFRLSAGYRWRFPAGVDK
ncbi:MAG TPA: hypothetical protein VFX42_05855 [Gemmatimonadales bacterium]|nr:hypothetical protein [Gemmatimonadales bacterium]